MSTRWRYKVVVRTWISLITSDLCHSKTMMPVPKKWVGSHSFSRGNFSAFCCSSTCLLAMLSPLSSLPPLPPSLVPETQIPALTTTTTQKVHFVCRDKTDPDSVTLLLWCGLRGSARPTSVCILSSCYCRNKSSLARGMAKYSRENQGRRVKIPPMGRQQSRVGAKNKEH